MRIWGDLLLFLLMHELQGTSSKKATGAGPGKGDPTIAMFPFSSKTQS